MTEKKQRGGKRDGAGRKSTNKEPTTVIRVPVSVAEQIKQSLNTVTESKQYQQTWIFSYEDLQEQARLLEKLQQENQHLKAELQAITQQASQPQPSIDIHSLDKIALLNLLKQLETRQLPIVYRYSQNQQGCECLNAKGEPCKNISEKVLLAELRLNVCKTHFNKYKHLD
jgi:hypothetical protein